MLLLMELGELGLENRPERKRETENTVSQFLVPSCACQPPPLCIRIPRPSGALFFWRTSPDLRYRSGGGMWLSYIFAAFNTHFVSVGFPTHHDRSFKGYPWNHWRSIGEGGEEDPDPPNPRTRRSTDQAGAGCLHIILRVRGGQTPAVPRPRPWQVRKGKGMQ